MGEGREETDLDPKRAGTEPGLGKASGAGPVARAANTLEEEAPPPVDFDALHAALGDPLEYEELSSGPAVDKAAADSDAGTGVAESSGATNATYASARPRTIPPTRAPIEDPNAPAVIVATDTDTVPTAPPQMTVPLAAAPQFAGAPRAQLGQPGSNPHVAIGGQQTPPSGPHGIGPAHPSSGPHAASPRASHPFTPQAFPVQQVRGAPQMTMRMPDRPVNMRRGKTPTIVVRPRGPSAKQKLVAFMAMLLLVTACGIAVIIWRKPRLLGLDPLLGAPAAPVSAPLPAVSAASSTGAISPISPITTGSAASSLSPVGVGTSSAGAAGATSPSPSAAASASAKKLPKPPVPVPHPTASVNNGMKNL